MSEKITALSLNIDTSEAVKSYDDYINKQSLVIEKTLELRNTNTILKKELKDLAKERANGNKVAIQTSKSISEQIARNNKDLKDLSKTNKEIEKSFKSFETAEGSIDAFKVSLSKLTAEYNGLSKAEREASKGEELKIKILEATKEIKSAEEGLDNYRRSVGKYQNALKEIKSEGSGAFSEIISGLGGADSSINTLSGSVGSLTKGFNKLKVNPIVAIFSVLASVAITLGAAFSKSEKGSRLMSKASAVLASVMGSLVNISVSVFDNLSNFGSYASDKLEPIITTLSNSFTGLFSGIESIGSAIGTFFSTGGDLSATSKELDGLSTSAKQFLTGDNLGSQSKIIDQLSKTKDEIQQNTQKYTDLESATYKARQEQRELRKEYELLVTQQELLQVTVDDTSKSIEEQNEASLKISEITVQASAKQLEIASTNLSLINAEIELRKAQGQEIQDLLDQQTDAQITVIEGERELTLSLANQGKERSQLRQDEINRELDILIDGFDNYKNNNLKIVENENKTLEERQRYFNEIKNIGKESFDQQIELIQSTTTAQIDANELLKESDQVALVEKIKALGLSDDLAGRLLESLRDRRDATTELEEAQIKLNEATENQKVVDIRIDISNQLNKLYNDTSKTNQEIQDEAARIQLEGEKRILDQTIKNSNISKEEKARNTSQLSKIVFEREKKLQENVLKLNLDTIELERISKIQSIEEEIKNEKEKSERIASVEYDAFVKTQEAKIKLAELSATERAEIELEITKRKNQQIKQDENKFRIETANIASKVLNYASQLQGLTTQLATANHNKEKNAIEEKYDALLDGLITGSEEEQRLQKEKQEELDKLERENFEENKSRSIAEVFISQAKAIANVLASPDLSFIKAIAQIPFILATTFAQIKLISSQEYKRGMLYTKGDKHGENGSFGIPLIDRNSNNQIGYIERDEAIVTSGATTNKRSLGVLTLLQRLAGGVSFGGDNLPPQLHNDLSQYVKGNVVPKNNNYNSITPNVFNFIPNQNIKIDYDLLSVKIIEGIKNMPSPILDISYLDSELKKYSSIKKKKYYGN